MLTVRWLNKEAKDFVDLLPENWFETEGLAPALTHTVKGPRGKPHEARCDVTVSGLIADLDYEKHQSFNKKRGMTEGVVRLEFTGPDRRSIARVWWRDPGGAFEPADVGLGSAD